MWFETNENQRDQCQYLNDWSCCLLRPHLQILCCADAAKRSGLCVDQQPACMQVLSMHEYSGRPLPQRERTASRLRGSYVTNSLVEDTPLGCVSVQCVRAWLAGKAKSAIAHPSSDHDWTILGAPRQLRPGFGAVLLSRVGQSTANGSRCCPSSASLLAGCDRICASQRGVDELALTRSCTRQHLAAIGTTRTRS